MLRCPHCRTRRSTWQLMAQHLKAHPECAPCDCGGYGWKNGGTLHRRGSTYCLKRWDGPANVASRAGASDTEVQQLRERLAAERECPF